MNTNKSFFERNGGTYSQVGDYLLPNLTINETEQRPIGKYGRMRKRYLKEHRPVLYTNLLVTGKLDQHLRDRRGLRGAHGTDHATNGKAGECDRGAQGYRPEGMGRSNEQHPEPSGRDRPAGVGL